MSNFRIKKPLGSKTSSKMKDSNTLEKKHRVAVKGFETKKKSLEKIKNVTFSLFKLINSSSLG